MRKLVIDGVSPSQVSGLDLHPHFHSLGQALFLDSSKLSFSFYSRDILDDSLDWEELEGRFDFLHVTSFLHIWDWEKQVRAAERLVRLAKPEKGSLMVGSGLGTTVSGDFPDLEGTGTNFRQSEESFVRFWGEVGERTGSRWVVRCEVKRMAASRQNEGQKWADPNMGILTFEVERM